MNPLYDIRNDYRLQFLKNQGVPSIICTMRLINTVGLFYNIMQALSKVQQPSDKTRK